MPGLSKVIVLDPDARAGRQVQLGFEREGVEAVVNRVPGEAGAPDLGADDPGLIVVGGVDRQGLELVRRVRSALIERKLDAPIMFAGRGVQRADAEAAGADHVVLRPAFLRDVVTLGRLIRGQPAAQRDHLIGNLAETTGVFTLVRALAALGRSAVLTLIRGLRRGEIRFFHGEVTSAQVGVIHGQAALHQLLLWTEARFDFRREDVVRRHQIPLSHDELFADAERFLEGVRDASGRLSPSMVLEQDTARVQALGPQVPDEVHGVLRMFDGHRVLADVLEDSPFRVFETLRVTQRAVDVGLLRPVDSQRPKATWRAVLAIEEWLVGSDRDEVLSRTAAESGPLPAANATARDADATGKKLKRKKRKKRRANTPVASPIVSKPEIDWEALVPRGVGAEVGSLSQVVPSAQASGEFEMPTREAPREKLEALMDTDKRERIFPTDIGLEPKVVFEEQAQVKLDADDRASDLVRQLVAEQIATPPVTVTETPSTVVAVHDTLTVTSSPDTARLVASPVATVTEAARLPVPEPATDEPSDGVVRSIGSVDTAPVVRRPPPGLIPADDRPEDTTGEITAPRLTQAPPEARPSEPSILVSDVPEVNADIAAVQHAISSVLAAQAAAPPSSDIATPAREFVVSEVRKDAQTGAVVFSETEEEFFRAGQEKEKGAKPIAPERFDDLDEGYQPEGFWDRLRGKKKREAIPPTRPPENKKR